jgi:hypothetical protein
MKRLRKSKLTVLLIQGRLLRKDCGHRKRLCKLQAKQKSGGSINANRLRQEKYIIKKLEDQLRESCQAENDPVGESSTQMNAHLPTEERNTTSDAASSMLAGETFTSAASSDTSENKLKEIARYIKSLLMCQDSIHETINSQFIERNFEHLELSNLEVSAVLDIHNFFKQLVLPRVGEVDVDKHVLVSLPVVKACNAILFRTCYSKLCRALVPNTKPSTPHALQLNIVGLYYLFFSKFGSNRAQTQDGNYIKNETMAKDNKDILFATIFKLNKIKQLCTSQGTEFDHRLIITSCHIVHLQTARSSPSTATMTTVGTRSNRGKRKRATDDENALDNAIKKQNSLIKIEEESISKLLLEIRDIKKTISNINVQINNSLDNITKKKTLVNERQTLKASMKPKHRVMLEKKKKIMEYKNEKASLYGPMLPSEDAVEM